MSEEIPGVLVLTGLLRSQGASTAFPMTGGIPELTATFSGVGIVGSEGGTLQAPVEIRVARVPLTEALREAIDNGKLVFRFRLEVLGATEEQLGLQPGWDLA